MDTSKQNRNPQPQGLYHPRNEHDACGMGLVASIRGEKSHEIIRKGLEVLINLTHRGAAGCDPETGDGAGILIQIPHVFFVRECGQLGMQLPEADRQISSDGLKLGKTTYASSPQGPKGTVIEQTPSQGSKVTSDTPIELLVAQ